MPALIEGLLNWLFHAASDGNKVAGAILAFACYLFLGIILGSLSLLVLATPVFSSALFQVIALIAATLSAGLTASAFGAWRRRRGKLVLRVDRFPYGAALGFGYGLVRMLAT